MGTAWSASATKGQPASASEYTAIARTPSERHARMIRRAISPRLAMRTLENTASGGLSELRGGQIHRGGAPAGLRRRPACRDRESALLSLEADLHRARLADLAEGDEAVAPRRDALEHGLDELVPCGAGNEPSARYRRVSSHEGTAKSLERVLEVFGHTPWPADLLEADELLRVVAERAGLLVRIHTYAGRQPLTRNTAGGLQQHFQLPLPGVRPLLERGPPQQVAEHDFARGNVPPLVLDAADEDAPRGRLVDGIGLIEVSLVGRQQVGLEHSVDADNSLHGLLRPLGTFEGVHEGHEGRIRRLGHLGRGAQLGQPPAPGVAVLGIVPDMAAHEELGRELRCQRDPAAQGAHHALGGIAVMADEARRVLDDKLPGQRMRHSSN